jgi:formylglycine-generating enzyme required for sulfatase activity
MQTFVAILFTMVTSFTKHTSNFSTFWLFLTSFALIVKLLPANGQQLVNMRKPIPPGCVQVNDSLFMDETEIQNTVWQNYLYYLKRDSIELDHDPYAMALPDTTVWVKEFGSRIGNPFMNYYHKSEETEYHPVVGITYEQAVAFCKWRSAMDTQLFNYQYKKQDKELAAFRNVWVEFHYRLPTEEEWEAACTSNNPNKSGLYGFGNTYGEFPKARQLKPAIDTLVKSKALNKDIQEFYSRYPHLLLANVKPEVNPYFITKRKLPRFTEHVYYYPPNELGLYGMIGNVAEMIDQKGSIKGGSWADPLSRCKYEITGIFNGPSTRVGFRCACTVKIYDAEPRKKFWLPNP